MSNPQEDFDNAVLAMFSGPDWDLVKKGLLNDIYHTQSRAFDAKDWGEVKELKGFAQGLLYVINLRDTITTVHKQESANAEL